MKEANEQTADDLWSQVCGRLEQSLPPRHTFCLGQVSAVALNDDGLILGAPNAFTRDWIARHLLDRIEAGAREAAGRRMPVELRIVDPTDPLGGPEPNPRTPAKAAPTPRYTFDTFVIGAPNRFAHAGALAVAEAPGRAYNPLLLYGAPGLGKTHLLRAIAHYVAERFAGLEVGYSTSETFLNEFVDSLGERRRLKSFKDRYRSYDVLLIDDVEFFAKKDRIQEEFLHTFDCLHQAGRQLVVSSDRSTREIPALADGLSSRFEMGLVAEIRPPDLETRLGILRKLAEVREVHVDEPELLTFIAERVTTNVRELEGALTCVSAYSSLIGAAMTVELAKNLLGSSCPPAEVSIERIEEAVTDQFGLTVDDLRGPRRTSRVAYPRQLAMHLARELTGASLPKIGSHFRRDHTTVLYASNRIKRLEREDRDVHDLVAELTARIRQVVVKRPDAMFHE